MSVISRLTDEFMRLPGIGPRQAQRFVYYLLTRDARTLENLAALIRELGAEVRHCSMCFRFFAGNGTGRCDICSRTGRNGDLLMVIEKDVDLENIERSRVFDGFYFILGGSVPILDKEPEKRVRSAALVSRVEQNGFTEIILALSATAEGDNTERYVRELLAPLQEKRGFKISHLGRGLSTGTELEYSDTDTLRNALNNRS